MALTQVNGGMLDSVAQQVGFRNRIINGAMMIDQRNAGASVTPASGAYTLDRWQYIGSQASKFTISQASGISSGVGGAKYALFAQTASPVSIGSGDYFAISQAIEGYNFADLEWGTASAKPVTLSFWVYSSLSGTFGGAIRSGSVTYRSYPFTYTVTSPGTWQYVTVTIPGDTSGSTWGTTNNIGAQLYFGLGVGSSVSGTAGAWATANYLSATGATSVVGTNGATFYITGVQLEKGSTATSFDYRPYGTELALCQRYYEIFTGNANATELLSGFFASSTNCYLNVYYKQTKRAKPTVTAPTGWVNITPGVWPSVDNCVFNGGGYFYINAGDGVTALTVSAEL